jgi:hypothetical protein
VTRQAACGKDFRKTVASHPISPTFFNFKKTTQSLLNEKHDYRDWLGKCIYYYLLLIICIGKKVYGHCHQISKNYLIHTANLT